MVAVIRMPAPLAQVTEAAVQTWLVAVGATVAVGDGLAEIETDKAVVDFAAEQSGTVARLLVDEGTNVAVGDPILVLAESGDTEADIERVMAAEGVGTPPAHDVQEGATTTEAGPAVASVPSTPADDARPSPEPTGAPTAPPPHDGRRFVTPLVRRLARERGIDLSQVTGSGPGGRIVRRDVDALPAAAERTAAPAGRSPVQPSAPTGNSAEFQDVPLTGMRRAIARRLTESKSTVPHFYMTAHVEVDALLALREQANAVSPRRLSVNDFVLKAVATALVRVPEANAVWNGDTIRRFSGVDLAVAVAVDGGLLTPVVRGAHALSLVQLSEATAALAERARAGRLRQDELEGGSFSVSNLGMYGVDEFAAILNPPQAGILAVGAAKPRAVVREDGSIAAATVLTVTMSADHRVIDGAVAAQWLRALVELLESPVALLIGVSGSDE